MKRITEGGYVFREDVDTLSHTTWDCKYHVVRIPKFRRKALHPEIPTELKRR
jgi:REP element-mobilizing transposase RayT